MLQKYWTRYVFIITHKHPPQHPKNIKDTAEHDELYNRSDTLTLLASYDKICSIVQHCPASLKKHAKFWSQHSGSG